MAAVAARRARANIGQTCEPAAEFELGGLWLQADPSGALYAPDEGVLIVADLHLEKGSAFARRRMLLPPYDTAVTLARLTSVVAVYRPRAVIALGDSFHDDWGAGRLNNADRATLRVLQAGRDWVWVAGNHDRSAPEGCGGAAAPQVHLAAVVLRHLPEAGPVSEIAGHLHPAARVVTQSGSARRRCFVTDGQRCVLPAFGAYAGGLNLRDRAFEPLFGARRLTALVLGRDRVHAVDGRFCVPEPR